MKTAFEFFVYLEEMKALRRTQKEGMRNRWQTECGDEIDLRRHNRFIVQQLNITLIFIHFIDNAELNIARGNVKLTLFFRLLSIIYYLFSISYYLSSIIYYLSSIIYCLLAVRNASGLHARKFFNVLSITFLLWFQKSKKVWKNFKITKSIPEK